MKTYLIHIVLLLTVVACGPRKSQPAAVDLDRQAIASYWAAQPEYSDLKIKSSIRFIGMGQDMTVSSKFQMRKDSILWASIGFFGLFEGMRLLVTPDSFHMLDHINHTYAARHVNDLKATLGMDIDLSDLQNILVGSPAFAMPLYSLISTDSVMVIRGTKDHLINTVGINDRLLTYRSAFRSNVQDQTGDFNYTAHSEFDGQHFPTEIDATLKLNGEMVEAQFKYSSVDTGAITSFAFNIPSSYKRI